MTTDRNRGRQATTMLCRFTLVCATAMLLVVNARVSAGPEGENVVSGAADFARQGLHTDIQVHTQNAIINYDSFNLTGQESVQFHQLNAAARVLNRIQSGVPTQIDGSITANGQVYFVNPAGVRFGQGAVLDVAGIYAAAGSISNSDFLNNINRFTDVQGDIVNQGTINSQFVALVGQRVINDGVIFAPNGLVTMASGDEVLIGEQNGSIMVKVQNNSGASDDVEAAVVNNGTIENAGGTTTLAASDMYWLGVKQSDTASIDTRVANVEATGAVEVQGTLDASDTATVTADEIAFYNAGIGGGSYTLNGSTVTVGNIAGPGSVAVVGTAGDDLHTIDMSLGSALPGGGLTFEGGYQETAFPGDILRVIGDGGAIIRRQTAAVDTGKTGTYTVGGQTFAWSGYEPTDTDAAGAPLILDFTGTTVTTIDVAQGFDFGTGTDARAVVTVNGDGESEAFKNATTVTILGGDGVETFTYNLPNASGGGNDFYTTSMTLSGDNTGGSDVSNDNFLITAFDSTLPFAIVGGGGAGDVVIGPNANVQWQLGDTAIAGRLTVDGVESVTGNAMNDTFNLTGVGNQPTTVNGTGGGTNVVVGTAGVDTFVLDAANGLTVGGTAFSNIATVNGGAGNDIFDARDGASIATIDGQADTDTLTYASFTGPVTIDLQANTQPVVTNGIEGMVENVIGSADAGDTIVGNNANTTWNVTAADTFNDGSINFSAIENIDGGTMNDTFVVNNAANTLTGTLDGTSGTDTVNITTDGAANTISVVTASTTVDGVATNYANIDDLNLNTGDGADVITVAPQPNFTVDVDAQGTGGDMDSLTFDLNTFVDAELTVIGGTPTLRSTGANFMNVTYMNVETVDAVNGTFSIGAISAGAAADNGTADGFLIDIDGASLDVILDADGGGNATLLDNIAIGSISDLTVTGSGDNDLLTVDFSSGAVPTFGITFNGMGQTGTPGDGLTIQNVTTTTTTYNFTGPGGMGNDGSVALAGAGTTTITFTGLEPITNTGTAADVIFNLPDGAINDDAILANNAAAGSIQLTSASADFENTIFTNPTNSLTINLGDMGDTITVNALDAAYDADLTISGSAMAVVDTITLNATTGSQPVILNGGDGNDVFAIGMDSLDTIGVQVTVNGGAGAADTATFDDANDGTAETYALTLNSLTVSGLAHSYSGLETLNVDGSDAGDTVTITSTNAITATDFDLGGGNDIITITSGALGGTLNLDGEGQAVGDTLTVNGVAGDDAFSLADTTIMRTGDATITYAGFETLNIDTMATAGGDTIDVTDNVMSVGTAVNLTVSGAITDNGDAGRISTADTTLNATGAITINTTVTGGINATSTGVGDIDIDQTGPQTSLNIDNQNGAADFSSDSAIVDTDAATDLAATTTATISSTGGDIGVTANRIEIDAPMVVGTTTTADNNQFLELATGVTNLNLDADTGLIALTTSGTINQADDVDVIDTDNLVLSGSGTFTLDGNNTVGTISSDMSGTFLLENEAMLLTVGTGNGVAGITSGTNVTLITETSGNIALANNINVTGNVTVNAFDAIAGAGNTITSTGGALDLDAADGIGGTGGGDGDALLTSAGSIAADNTTGGDIHVNNTFGGGTTLTSARTDNAGVVDINHASSLLTVNGTVSTDLNNDTVGNGGTISVLSDTGLDISAATFTTTGGAVPNPSIIIVSGGITFGATFNPGAGTITLGGGANTLSFDQDQTFPSSVVFNLPEDIIINANLLTVSGGVQGDITLNADSDNNGTGGVRVSLGGLVQAEDLLTINGSDLVATVTANDAVLIDNDGGNDQIVSVDNMIAMGISSNANGNFIIEGDADAETGMTFASGGGLGAGGTTQIGASFDSQSGTIDFQDDVIIIGDTDLTNATGAVDWDGTVNDDGSVSSSDVQVTVATAFNIRGVVGGGANGMVGTGGDDLPIESITVGGAGVTNAFADVFTDGSTQTYNTPFIVSAATVTLTDAGSGIFFNNRVDSMAATNFRLNVNTTAGGVTRFGDAPGVDNADQVGGVQPLGSLFTDSGIAADGTTIINTDLILTDNAGTGVGAVNFADAVTIAHTADATGLTIDTTGNAGDTGGPVTFGSTLTGNALSANHLIIDAGVGFDVLFNGTVGGTRLGNLDVIRAMDVTANSSITARSLGFNDANAAAGLGVTGNVSVSSFINTNGEISVAGGEVGGPIEIDADGTVSIVGNSTAVGATNTAAAGFNGGNIIIVGSTVSIGGANSSGGASTFAGANGGDAGTITVDSESGTPQITISGNVLAAGGTEGVGGTVGLGNDILLGMNGDMDAISLSGGADLQFSSGTNDGSIDINGPLSGPGGIGLTLLSGDDTMMGGTNGVIDFEGTVQNLTFLTITNARNVNFDMAVGGPNMAAPNVGNITQANGSGTTTTAAGATLFSSGNIDISNERIVVNANVVTQGGGNVTYNTDLDDAAMTSGMIDILDIADGVTHTLNGGGSFVQAGGGANMPVSDLGGDITTTGTGSISFADHVRLTNGGLVTLTTGGALGADISFSKNLFAATDYTEDITLNAGASGDISVDGMVGENPAAAATGEIDIFTIANARNTQFADTFEVTQFVQTTGTGNTTFENDITVNQAAGSFGFDVNTSGTLTLDNVGTMLTALMNADFRFRVGDVAFNGGAGTITTTGFVRFEPFANGADIAVGVGGATYTITNTDVLALADGAMRIEIGEDGTAGGADGTGTVLIGNGVTFSDPTYFRAPVAGGSIDIQSALNGTGDSYFVFDSRSIEVGGDITTAGNGAGGAGGVAFVSGGSEGATMVFTDIDDDRGDAGTATDGLALVVITDNAVIDTTNGGASPMGARIVFENRINGDGGSDNLTLNSGTASDIEVGFAEVVMAGPGIVDGLVGAGPDGLIGTADDLRLGDIIVTNANDVNFGAAASGDGSIVATSFTQLAGTGNTSLNGTAAFGGGGGKPTALRVGQFDDEAGGMVTVTTAGTFLAAANINARGGANTGGGNGFDGGSVNVQANAIDVQMIDTSGSAANTAGNGGDAAPITLQASQGGGMLITLRGDQVALGGAAAGGGTIGDAADQTFGDGANDTVVLDPSLLAFQQVATLDTITASGNDILWDATVDAAVANADSLVTNTADNFGQVPIFGTNTFNFNVGHATELNSLTTNYIGTQVPGGATVFNPAFINALTAITINDRAIVGNASITFQGNNAGGLPTVTTIFNSTLDTTAAANDITVEAITTRFNGNAGTLGVDGVVGGGDDFAFDTFTTDFTAGDMTFLNATTFNGDEFFFNDPILVDLAAPMIVTVTGTTGVDFLNTVDSAVGEMNNLTVNTGVGGVINFGDPASAVAGGTGDFVGATTPLNDLVTGATGTTVFNAGDAAGVTPTVTTVGNQTYNNPVVIGDAATAGDNVTLTGQNITFISTINASQAPAGNESLTVITGNGGAMTGVATYTADIGTGANGTIDGGGDDRPLAFLNSSDVAMPGSGLINLAGAGGATEIMVSGGTNTVFNEPTVLLNDVTITQQGTADVRFQQRLDSNGAGVFGLTTGSSMAGADFFFFGPIGSGFNGMFESAGGVLGGDDTPLAFITTDPGALQMTLNGAMAAVGATQFFGLSVYTAVDGGMTTSGQQTYNDTVFVGDGIATPLPGPPAAPTVFTGEDLLFNNAAAALDAVTADGLEDVTLVAIDDITFLGDIGGGNTLPLGEAIHNITFTAGGDLMVQGVFTTGTQTYNFASKLVLTADLRTDGASLLFNGTMPGAQLILMDPDGTVVLDTNDDTLAGGPSTGNSGNVTMTNLEVSADTTVTQQDFSIFTESDDMLPGDVILQGFNDDTVGGMGGSFVNDLTIEASSVAGTPDADQAFLQLNADIQLDDNGTGDAADFRFDTTFTSEVYISDDTPGTSLIVDTEIGDTAAGGLINWTAQISADAPGQDLVLDTSSTSFAGGNITHTTVDNNGGVATAGNPTPAFLNDFTAIAGGTTFGIYDWANVSGITLDDEGAGADPGDFTVTNANIRTVFVATTIDTEATNDFTGGNVDLSTSMLSSNTAGNNGIVINTLTDGAGMTGGNVTLGEFGGDGNASVGFAGNVFGAHFIRNLTVNTTGDTPFGGNLAGTGADGVTNVIFDILVDGNSSGPQASVTIVGDLRIDVDPTAATIDTEATGDELGGFVNLQNARVFGNAPARMFTIDTSSAAVGGGAVDLGPVNAGTGSFLNILTVTTTGPGAADGVTTLHENISLDDSTNGGGVPSVFTIVGDGNIVISDDTPMTPLVVDTEQGGDANGGAVNWNVSIIDADAVGQDLSILTNNNAVGMGFSGGAVSFGEISSGGTGGSFLNDALIDATGDTIFGLQPADVGADGVITINDNRIDTDDDGMGDLASITLRGEVQITFNSTTFFDTQAGDNAAGGPVDLSRAGVSATADGLALDIDTSTGAAFAGGTVQLHRFNAAGGSFVENLVIDTGGMTPGSTTLNANILLDPMGAAVASFDLNDDGDLIISDDTPLTPLIIDLEQGGDESAATSFFDVDASNISADAQGQSLVIDVSSASGGGSGGEIRVDTIDDGTVSIAGGGGGFFLNDLALIVTAPGEAVGTAQIEIANDASALGGLITTDRHQHYYGPTVLFADTALNSNGIDGSTAMPGVGNIDFTLPDAMGVSSSSIDGAFALVVNTGLVNANGGMNMTRFNGPVGATTPLVSLTTNADGITVIGNNITTVGGTQTYNDAVYIEPVGGLAPANTVTLTDTGSTGITFASTVDAGSANPFGLDGGVGADPTPVMDAAGTLVEYVFTAIDPDLVMAVNAGGGGHGSITFAGAVGNFARLGDVLVTNTFNFTYLPAAPVGPADFIAKSFIQSGDSVTAGTTILDPDANGGVNDTIFNGLLRTDGMVGVANTDNNGAGQPATVGRGGDVFIATGGNIALNDGGSSVGVGAGTGGDFTFHPGSTAAADGGQALVVGAGGALVPTGIVQFGGTFTLTGAGGGGDFHIVPNGYTAVPGVSTFQGIGPGDPNANVSIIVGSGNIAVNDTLLVNNPAFNPAGNNKGTFFGDLLLRANGVGGSITIMDVNSFGMQTVDAPTINLLLRPASMFLNNFGMLQTDLGLDFVSGGDFIYSVAPTLLGVGPNPIFANVDAMVPIGSPLAGFIQTDFPTPIPQFATFAPNAFGPGSTPAFPGTLILDLTTLGASNANVAEAIAAAIPTPEQSGDVIRDLLVGTVQRDLLTQLGFDLRDLTTLERLEFVTGRALMNDMPGDLGLRSGNPLVATDRMFYEPVRQLLDVYRRTMLETGTDPATGEPTLVSRHVEIRRNLGEAYDAYQATGAGFDAGLMITYLRADRDRFSEALDALEGLAELEKALLNAGLSPREADQAMRSILERLATDSGLTVGQVYELVREAGKPSAEPTATGAPDEPIEEVSMK